LEHKFKQSKLLERALVTKNYADQKGLPADFHNEVFEKIGDALISFLAVEQAFNEHKKLSADIHDYRKEYVGNKLLSNIAEKMDLYELVKWSEGQKGQSQWQKSEELYADCIEAIIGAIYLDRGFKEAKKAFWNLIHKYK